MPLDGLLAAAAGDELRALAQLGDERLHALGTAGEGLVPLDPRREESHSRSLSARNDDGAPLGAPSLG
jgi:hypothetical protein